MNTTKNFVEGRIPAIDTLRVVAIAVLVMFHHAMIYVPDWGFHYKVETEWVFLQNLMVVTSPWRMGLLWLISGIALSFMITKISIPYALLKRTSQLLFPLLIGVLLIVPPQLYIEMSQASEMPLSYSEFTYALFFQQGEMFRNFTAGIWPSIDVNHLWFLRSLWQYSLLAILISPLLATTIGKRVLAAIAKKIWLILLAIFVLALFIQEAFSGDLVRESYGLVWFFVGFSLGRYLNFWNQISEHAKVLISLAVLSLIAVQIGFFFVWKSENPNEFIIFIAEFGYILNRTVMPIAIVAAVYKWFNHAKPQITRLNTLVFPLYIIHQSVSIVVAFLLSSYAPEIPLFQHFLLSTLFVLMLCFSILITIERSNVLRPAFGMPVSLRSQRLEKCVQAFTFCCSVPIGLEILF
ncbi:acyltransferase family protein [Idiomarina sp. ST20R2A10]|uniref:acyltransferase family protein n=1 Tax=Idiomarina sp. ST20R2A10 TaxID=3418369 RepID=UPI003EC79013